MWQGQGALELLSFGGTLCWPMNAAAVGHLCPVPRLSSCSESVTSALQSQEALVGRAHFRYGQTESCPGDFALIRQWQEWASKVFPRPPVGFGPLEL